MVLTGRLLTAEEALIAGVVSRVVSDAELDLVAAELAAIVAHQPPLAVRLARQVIDDLGRAPSTNARYVRNCSRKRFASSEDRGELSSWPSPRTATRSFAIAEISRPRSRRRRPARRPHTSLRRRRRRLGAEVRRPVSSMRAPDAATGWPRLQPLPLTLTVRSSRSNARTAARGTDA